LSGLEFKQFQLLPGVILPARYFGFQRYGLPLARSSRWSLASAALTVTFCLIAGFGQPLSAQKADKPDRKVLVSSQPLYPDLLKRAQIGGLVRLKATVLINGTVSSVAVVGGNPVLGESAVAAIKKWKFAPAASQTVEDIAVNFNPHAE